MHLLCRRTGGPAESKEEEYEKYGANRIAEGKLPLCAEMCSTKALLAGDAQTVADIFRQRVVQRGHPDGAWSDNPQAAADSLAYDATRQG